MSHDPAVRRYSARGLAEVFAERGYGHMDVVVHAVDADGVETVLGGALQVVITVDDRGRRKVALTVFTDEEETGDDDED